MFRDDPPDLERGRYAARQVVLLFVGVEVIVALHYWLAIGLARAPQQAVRTGIAALLALALWKGYKWARWTICVLSAIGLWVAIPAAYSVIKGSDSVSAWYAGLLLLSYVIIVRILLWSPHLPVFMAAQRAAATGSPRAEA